MPSDPGIRDTATTPVDTGTTPPPVDSSPPPSIGYPAGPYGFSTGSTFPNVSFKGYHEGTGVWSDVSMSEYYDPDGSRHVNALWLDVSASWCSACRAEAGDLPDLYTKYKPRGGRVLTALIENDSSSPATQSTVDSWDTSFSVNFDIVADPMSAALPKGGVGLPHNYLIDPRTMKIVKVVEGADPGATTIPGMDALLVTNGG
jgi:hypothetical protein